MTVKIEFADGTHKCYTNVVEHTADNGFFTIIIANNSSTLTKLWPATAIKHAQVEH